MTDYSELIKELRACSGYVEGYVKECEIAANALEEQAKRIAELEAFRKKELDFYLLEKKQMSRRIALLSFWMKKIFKYADANRNQLTMTTEIPDTLIREGMDYLTREEKGDEQ